MGTARRLYLYVVSLVSLVALTGGIGSLLQLAFQRIEDAVLGAGVMGGGLTSGQAALSVAMIVVGGPVFALHWWLVRRGMHASGSDGPEDRTSAVRAGYLALVMGISLAAAVWALIALVETTLVRVVGSAQADDSWATPLAVALVAVPTWAIHGRTRWLEIRSTRMAGASAWLTRLYRYLATYGLLIVLLAGASGLLATLLSVLVGRPDFGIDEAWWRIVAAGQVGAIVVGGGALLAHWREAERAIRDADEIGEDDRLTRLRAAFFGGALLTTVSWAALGVAGAIADAGRLLTGMIPSDPQAWLESVVGPPIALLPVVIGALWVAAAVRREAAPLGRDRVLAARRLTLLLPSLAGLAFLAAGITQLLETGLLGIAGVDLEPIIYGQNRNFQVPWYVAQVIVGAALWLPCWLAQLEGRRREPVGERTALASRAYLFLVVGAATVAAVPATIVILYRALEPLLGGASGGSLAEELAFPIAVLLTAVAAGAYHVPLLLGDLAVAGQVPVRALESASARGIAPEPVSAEPHPATVDLVLELPEGESVPEVVEELQSHLPPGVHLHLRPTA
jgi:hypothetical protein